MKFESFFEKEHDLDVIIQAGQSNAEGCGRGGAGEPYIPTDRVLYLTNPFTSEILSPAEDIEYQLVRFPDLPYVELAAEREMEGTVGDFSLSFSREYLRAGQLKPEKKLLIVRAGVGGTGFAKGFWLPGGVCFTNLMALIDRVKGVKGNKRFLAFLWHQGEHDAWENPTWDGKTRGDEYAKHLNTVIASVRERCQAPDLPVIAAGLCADWAAKHKPCVDAVLQGMQKTLAAAGNAAFINTAGLMSNRQAGASETDDIHFSREALNELGQRYYKAYIKLLDGAQK
jgi:hypothetical protein